MLQFEFLQSQSVLSSFLQECTNVQGVPRVTFEGHLVTFRACFQQAGVMRGVMRGVVCSPRLVKRHQNPVHSPDVHSPDVRDFVHLYSQVANEAGETEITAVPLTLLPITNTCCVFWAGNA
jgi:hypothetical protein